MLSILFSVAHVDVYVDPADNYRHQYFLNMTQDFELLKYLTGSLCGLISIQSRNPCPIRLGVVIADNGT